jgi:hypothetical protein
LAKKALRKPPGKVSKYDLPIARKFRKSHPVGIPQIPTPKGIESGCRPQKIKRSSGIMRAG